MATPASPTRFRIGYATSGFANHRLEDAIDVIAGLGYRAITLTLDVHHLDPFAPDLAARTAAVRKRLEAADLGVVVECGARFLLDPWRKHRPGLIDPDRARREDFMRLAIGVAADLGADCVSFWSGARPETMSAGRGLRAAARSRGRPRRARERRRRRPRVRARARHVRRDRRRPSVSFTPRSARRSGSA